MVNLPLNENVDYELYAPDDGNAEWWNVRILKGEYTGTEFYFGAIKANEVTDKLSFSFQMVSSPQNVQVTDTKFQEYAGNVLNDVMERSLSDGSILPPEQNLIEELN